MKLCIPAKGNGGMEAEVKLHFGRAPTFTMVDTETNDVKVIDNTSQHMGGHGYPPEIMQREGVEIMLWSGLGPRAITMLKSFGIEVFVGASATVKDAVAMWREGKLPEADDVTACREHRRH